MSLSSTTTVRGATRFVSPLLYGAGCVFAFVTGVVLATSPAFVRLSKALPGNSYLFEHVVLLVVLLPLFCALLLAVVDLTLYRLGRSRNLGLRDRARYCALLLYAGIALVLVVLLAILELEAGTLQYVLGLALCAAAAYGILVDAGVVLSMRRLTRTQPGGAP